MAPVFAKSSFKFSRMAEIFFESRFLALASWVVLSEDPAVKEVGRQKATTPPTATPDSRALLLLQKIIEGDELNIQKPELLRLLLKDAVDRHELLIEIAKDRQPVMALSSFKEKPISPFVTKKVLVCGRNDSSMAMKAS